MDMSDGSLAFWANGKFLGVVKDNEGKPVNLKGKKVAPWPKNGRFVTWKMTNRFLVDRGKNQSLKSN